MNRNALLNQFCKIELSGETILLLPEKAIYWPEKKMLLIADLHLGKTTHFRNNGIAVPQKAADSNWIRLHRLFNHFDLKRVCYLGDLFHSSLNRDWNTFEQLIGDYPSIEFELIIGNHDILAQELYTNIGFTLYESKVEGPFLLTHEPLQTKSELYNLAGHIHPGVVLKGKAKQRHRLPCFHFGKTQGLLPAFGSFTGLATITLEKEDQVFVITKDKVIGL